jgi:nucleoside-diphosphate-sugar epimerase
MRLLFVGGTGPVGVAACRAATERGHRVIVAHTGAHELPNDINAEHLHGTREELFAPKGLVEKARPDVIIDTRAKAGNVSELLRCARAAGTHRLVVVSSTDVYEAFVKGSGYDVEAKSWDGVRGRTVLPSHTLPITEDAPMRQEPYPWATPGHDNAAMERALFPSRPDPRVSVAVLRASDESDGDDPSPPPLSATYAGISATIERICSLSFGRSFSTVVHTRSTSIPK